jgi:acyl-CoA hydrolase/GNAT superfamily N-acetyltransferase
MPEEEKTPLSEKIVPPQKILEKIKPGMSIFLGTGNAEPRTLVKALMESEAPNLQDLEFIQLVSFGDAVSIEEKYTHKFRLKTFFAGWIVSEAIRAGRVDLIPGRFSRIPMLIDSGTIKIDVAFIQITPPDNAGYSSLGPAIDVARQAMEKASLVVGEINQDLPRTLGDTFVHVDDFDFFVEGLEAPMNFPRWPVDDVYDKVGFNVASLIQDRSCISFGIGPLFESLAKHLVERKNLGVVTTMFTDALMELVVKGVITNRYKRIFRGKSLTSYALGSEELMKWLDRNPLVEFQPIDLVGDPVRIGSNEKFMVVLPARKIDLTGGIALHTGKGNVAAGPGEALEFITGAGFSRGGRAIFALPSRNLKGETNIVLSVDDYPNHFNREVLDLVVTEYGVASLTGRTVRERALALIDIAHPDYRETLVRLAKEKNLLYQDQEYFPDSGRHYPAELEYTHSFNDGLIVRFRAIKPSDVDQMRRLFYGFSDKSVYYRYFSPVKTMPHSKMQEYANIDYDRTMSIVGLVGEPGEGRIIAEGRYVFNEIDLYADVAFIVDESYSSRGIASFMLNLLIDIARGRGIKGLKADVLASNKAMMKVFEKSSLPIKAVLNSGAYELRMPFSGEPID